MDTPRRWQVASIATAVAGLGLGSLLVGRSPSIEVAPIDLDTAMIASSTDAPPINLLLPDPAEIVIPEIREDRVEPPVEPLVEQTPASLASPDAGPPSSSERRTDQATEPAPTAPAAPRADPDSPDSPDSPESVDSPDSVDSVDD